jgi:hypothetical protein
LVSSGMPTWSGSGRSHDDQNLIGSEIMKLVATTINW